MRFLALVIAAAIAAFFDASVFPWIPGLSYASVVGATATALAAFGLKTRPLVAFTIVAALLADAIAGMPFGARAIAFAATFVLSRPILRTLRIRPSALAAAALGAAFAFADRAAAVIPFIGDLPLTGWRASSLIWWWLWMAIVNMAVGYVALRLRRHAARRR